MRKYLPDKDNKGYEITGFCLADSEYKDSTPYILTMFCPKCGRDSKGLCIKCYLESNKIILDESEIPFCECGGWLYRGAWSGKPDDAVNYIVKKNIRYPSKMTVEKIKVLAYAHDGRKIDVDVMVCGKYNGDDFSETAKGAIKTPKVTCPKCSRIAGSYFEAVLQLRGVPEIGIEASQISRVEHTKGGKDVYLLSANYAKTIWNEYRKLGCTVAKSAKITGRKDGVDVYRTYLSVKPAPFRQGDFIKHSQRIYMVTKPGAITNYRDLTRGKNGAMPVSKLRDCQIAAKREDVRCALVSAVSPGEAQLMDLETHETFDVRTDKLAHGQEVKFVKIEGRVYVV